MQSLYDLWTLNIVGNVVNSVKYVKPAKPLVSMETENKIKAREGLAKMFKKETKQLGIWCVYITVVEIL